MSNTTDKMLDRYVYLHIDYDDWSAEKEESGITVHVKMDDEGVVVDAWGGEDKCIASTWKTYAEMGADPYREKRVKIVWTAGDVNTLKPDWTIGQCQKWLDENAKYIMDRSIEVGWEIIETLLPVEKSDDRG